MPHKISWLNMPGYTGQSWNPVTGCDEKPISPGCNNCYARRMAARNLWGYDFTPRLHADRLDQPSRWKKPRAIFVCSMGDLFCDGVSIDWKDQVYDAMIAAPQHRYILLTKRPLAISSFYVDWPNVWWGVSVENNNYAHRIDTLCDIDCAGVKFVSHEPALGAIDWQDRWFGPGGIGWVIVGGETGPGARPMPHGAFMGAHNACRRNGVPFYLKSIGTKVPGIKSVTGTIKPSWQQFPEV